MNSSLMESILAWLLTYAIHSTLLIGLAWLLSRRAGISYATRDVLWKVALVGGVVTSIAQQSIRSPIVRSFALRSSTEAAAIVESPSDASTSPTTRVQVSRNAEAVSASDPAPSNTAPNAAPASTMPDAESTSWSAIIVLGWMTLALLLSVTYIGRRLVLIGRLANRRVVVDGQLPAMLDALRRSVKHRSRVRLTWVNTIASPVALGTREICLPEAALTDLQPDEQRSMLAHELAHLARRDPFWLALIALIERVFFFQPLNRVARVALQRNAEFLCDDWAASEAGTGLPLAQCLERVAEWMEATPLGVPVAGMAEQRSLLVTRIARLLEGRRHAPTTSRLAVSAGTVLVLAVTTAAVPGVRTELSPSSTIGASTTLMTRASGDSASTASNQRDDSSVANGIVHEAEAAFADATSAAAPSISGTVKPPVVGVLPSSVSDAEPTAANVVPLPPEHSASSRGSSTIGEIDQDTAVVSALIERLKDSDASVRRAAAASLGHLRSRRAVNALIAAAGDRNREVRHAVIEALAEMEDPTAMPALLKALNDDYVQVRTHALDGLRTFHEELRATSFLPLLKDASPEVRAKAVERLGEIGDRSAIDELTPLLRDANAEVRRAALEALKEYGDRSITASILPLLRDREAEVRSAALEALRELKATLSEGDVIRMMEDSSPEVRSQVLEFLGESLMVPLIPSIRKLLDDPNGEVREHAVEALAAYRDPAARTALRGALKSDDPNVRRRAAEALGGRQ